MKSTNIEMNLSEKNLILKSKVITAIIVLFLVQAVCFAGKGDTSWMTKGKYGVFMHYQYRILLGYSVATNPKFPEPSVMTASQWNQFVDGFDVKGFANQMYKAKVGWVMFCLDDHYFAWPCSPNSKFSKYTGYASGQKCSNRDLIIDVADALNAKGIKLIVYYAGLNGYMKEPQVMKGLGDTISRGEFNDKTPPSAEVRKRRLEVLKEYADRFGTKIAGWWFDTPGKDSYDSTPNDWWAINAIVHSANPKAVIALAQGGMSKMDPLIAGIDDYTGGDTWSKQDLTKLIPNNYPVKGGILWHGKIYCGNVYHGMGNANQFSDVELITWIRTCNSQGGVCTLDWPFDPNTGLIKDFGFKQMLSIRKALK
jgi:hypothetical protein